MIKEGIEKEIDVDAEDFYYFIIQLENDFGINFTENDAKTDRGENLKDIKVADLINMVIGKIELEHSQDCTSQQIFYRLRAYFVNEKDFSKDEIKINSDLENLIQRQDRKATIAEIEDKLEIKADILTIKTWLQTVMILAFLGGLIFCFINIKIGISLFIIFWGITKIKGNELKPKTLGELTKMIVEQNYRTLRDRKQTFNPKEVEQIIFKMICEAFVYENKEINFETKIAWQNHKKNSKY